MGAVVMNGDEFANSISSGGIGSGDTLVSSTYGGNDTVSIFSPSYDVHLGAGDDRIQGGIGGYAYGEDGNDSSQVFLWSGVHTFYGGDGDDRMRAFYGGVGSTWNAYGGAGSDLIFDNTSQSDSSTLSFYGGAGFDVVIHAGTNALQMTLGGTGTQGPSSKSYTGIEGAVGGSGSDTMRGSGSDNFLVGGNGSDVLYGGNGDDFLIGEAREEGFVTGYVGIGGTTANPLDPLNSAVAGAYAADQAENDSLYGGSGNDVLSGGGGADLLSGGGGSDWATYLSAPEGQGVSVNLASGGIAGAAAGDIYVSIENIQGSNANDTLAGNGVANELRGMSGQELVVRHGRQ